MANLRLTQKEEDFVIQYYKVGNETEAAKLAGYSPKSAYSIGCENLTKPKIIARLNELRKQTEKTTTMTVHRRQERLTEIAEEDNIDKYGYKRGPNVAAIDLLNKMDGIYKEESRQAQVTQIIWHLPGGNVMQEIAQEEQGENLEGDTIEELPEDNQA